MHSLTLLLTLGGAVVSGRVFDRLHAVPEGWRKSATALATDKLSLKIGLKQQHAAALEQAVLAMSSPDHPDYGKHMSREELRSYVAPSPQVAQEVTSWLAGYEIESSVDNDWITISTDVSTANSLLDADFHWYEHAEASGSKLRTLSYSVPDFVALHVDLVQPTTRFGHPGIRRSTIFEMEVLEENKAHPVHHDASSASEAGFCNTTVTPACLRAQYNINYTADANCGNLIGFASYLEQSARYADLAEFEKTQVPEAIGQNFSVVTINGGTNDQASSLSSGEANLDVQYVLGISRPIPIVEYLTGGRGPLVPSLSNGYPSTNEPYLEFLTYILNLSDAALPQTLTTSYGEEEQSVPRDYALKVCNMFMQLGARGVSVLFSSGDSGPGGTCKSNVDNTTTLFQPNFPAGCPYVTSVGGTSGSAPERGVPFSSGGFSMYHERPEWQDAAVSKYLDSIGDTYAGLYNDTGRAIPDVAAQGQLFVVIDSGRTTSLSGTSASSPTFAGVVALLNAARRAQGKPGLGFLNPFLYRNAAALTDITTGYSTGCRGGGAGLPPTGARWNCTQGWDPVTGLGTPKFDALLEVAAPGTPNQ
ncbi:hypothetical protein M406DRAFT_71314 [Cryphonectria parasitica EP155]|uniref:tripeptidyl-peptidase II n=1 Tax=Cryphonectria parasitica (strain ATCC 38755 / EP155) TaxID=660469 RepID=A0A9P5CNG6_CRYP1|nr:uncharacterized protein M406DRAFT_71314 [Cryphonectria parasitica EP155]KAF3764121.1 hypothetical protein M406DRAFT_71314 [Cryphonectria parasitica EP155]